MVKTNVHFSNFKLMTASAVDWNNIQVFQETEVLGLDQSIQDLFYTCLNDNSTVRSSKDPIKGETGSKFSHEIEYAGEVLEEGMTLEFHSDQPHICRIVGHSEKQIKIEVRSPITPCFLTVNVLVCVKTAASGVLAPLEIMQIEASFD